MTSLLFPKVDFIKSKTLKNSLKFYFNKFLRQFQGNFINFHCIKK